MGGADVTHVQWLQPGKSDPSAAQSHVWEEDTVRVIPLCDLGVYSTCM
jgi:hypothetical protein